MEDLEKTAAKFKVVIDGERCKGCYLCVNACPKGVLEISKESNETGYFPASVKNIENCVGCTACGIMCGDTCIEIYRESNQD
jgi:2-oxoglutarate ferredoxin oxidoreductase subunit delta